MNVIHEKSKEGFSRSHGGLNIRRWIERGFREDGAVKSIKNLSSYPDNNCIGRICLVQLFGILESFGGLQLLEEGLNDKLPLNLINCSSSTAVVTHTPHLSHMAGSCARLPRAACSSLWESGMGRKDRALKLLGIFALTPDDCF